MIVTAIAMGRCAEGTQQVLVPCRCLLQLKIQGPPGVSHGPRSRSILGEDLPCPSPVLGGESLIFSKSPSPSPAQAQPARMIPRHICSMPATCSTLVIRCARPHKTPCLEDPGDDAQGLHRAAGPDTEPARAALTAHTMLTRSPPKRKTRSLAFRRGKCSRAWLWERAAAPR